MLNRAHIKTINILLLSSNRQYRQQNRIDVCLHARSCVELCVLHRPKLQKKNKFEPTTLTSCVDSLLICLIITSYCVMVCGNVWYEISAPFYCVAVLVQCARIDTSVTLFAPHSPAFASMSNANQSILCFVRISSSNTIYHQSHTEIRWRINFRCTLIFNRWKKNTIAHK